MRRRILDHTPAATRDGLESVERVELGRLLVAATPDGGRELGSWYWHELERSLRGIVRARADGVGMRIVLIGGFATLLRFGEAEVTVADGTVECRYPVLGGSLAARPGGSLAIVQRADPTPRLEVVVSGYHPRLAGRGWALHRGLLYIALQAPLHRLVTRRFLTRSARRHA